MARNMCYDHNFEETRETLLVEKNINADDLHTALIGTLHNCAVLQARFEKMCEKITILQTIIEKKEIDILNRKGK